MERLVTVIIPTYRRSPDIVGNAIKSVLNQTYKNTEVIVVDDSPNDFADRDNIKEMIRMIGDSRLVYIRHHENLGASAARNTGVTCSKGKFIAFLDDDDEWHPFKLEKQISLFENGRVGLVYSSIKEITKENGQIKKTHCRLAKNRGNLFEELMSGNIIGSTSCVVFRREVFDNVGLFDVNLNSAEDYEMYLRTSQQYEIDFVEGPPLINYYRYQGERISNDGEAAFRSREYIYNKYRKVIDENIRYYNRFFLKRAIVHAEYGDYKKAIKYFISAVFRRPIDVERNIFTIKNIVKIIIKNLLSRTVKREAEH